MFIQSIQIFKEIKMNKKSGKVLGAVMVLMIILSAFPMGMVLAANDPAEVSVTVMNNTVGSVSLHLTGEGGSFWLDVSASGMGKLVVPEGKYDYYLSTPCGGESGEMNLNVAKVLRADCGEDPDLSVENRAQPQPACSNYEWWHYYYGNPQNGHWHPGAYASGFTPFYFYYDGWEVRCTDDDPNYFIYVK
jgi:hypothetical protein